MSASSGNGSRIVNFRRRVANRARTGLFDPSPVQDLAKYERSEAPDDYRHRMLMNGAALLVTLVLMGIGLWLAETMANTRKNEDCALTGRRNCMPIEVSPSRW
jgi:hypothetical protein